MILYVYMGCLYIEKAQVLTPLQRFCFLSRKSTDWSIDQEAIVWIIETFYNAKFRFLLKMIDQIRILKFRINGTK